MTLSQRGPRPRWFLAYGELMRHFLLFLCASVASAQSTQPTPLSLPPVNVQTTPTAAPGLQAVPSAPLVFQVATTVRVQPARLEVRVQPGYSTVMLPLTLMSEVHSQVKVVSSDPRLVIRGAAPLSLPAYQLTGVNAIALAPHSGTISVVNSVGTVIAQVPYVIAPAKTVNQSVNLNYSPSNDRVGLSYSISGVPLSPLDPRWNASVSTSLNTATGEVGGGINIGINW